MSTSELDSRNIAISMRKSVENLVISSQDAIGQSISQALTFSGVITQQAHQIIQDTKNVSRSPSPSLRHGDVDLLENDKRENETSIHVPCPAAGAGAGAGDSVSVSSASDIAPSATPTVTTSDRPKAPTPNSRGPDGSLRVKKKSWYTSLYPTYKSKSDDFKRLFKDLPDDERLIVDYSCALQKDILAHGRLYASQNYLCFHASIFGWETVLTLRWKDVTAITKEKTALVIPNAILVCTDGEKNFLTSFSGRDKAYLMLFRIWQNALMDSPRTSHEIWQWVHSCYGEELGFGSDDEGYSRDLAAAQELDLVDSSMEAASGAEGGREERGGGGAGGGGQRDSSPPLVTNGDGGGAEADGEGDTLPTDMSDSSDSEDKPTDLEKCTNEHSGKLLMRGQFPFNIDQLFTMIFTNSKFNLELLAARMTTDYVQAPWQVAAGVKCRQVSYVLGLQSGPIGPKETHITETQVMNKCSKPGHLYSIDCTTENRGIPYADYFTVEVHYCLARLAEHSTELTLYWYIKYKKTMWPMIKSLVEKNTMNGMEDFARLLQTRLVAEGGAAPAVRSSRHRHRRNNASLSPSEPCAVSAAAPPAALLAPRAALLPPRARPDPPHTWLSALLLLLLVVNALLYWRLSYPPNADIHTHSRSEDRMKTFGASQMGDWSTLLDQHTRRQRGQMLAWREALHTTVTHLHQTEKALRKLLETIEPALSKADDPDGGGGEGDSGGAPAGGDAGPPPARPEVRVEL